MTLHSSALGFVFLFLIFLPSISSGEEEAPLTREMILKLSRDLIVSTEGIPPPDRCTESCTMIRALFLLIKDKSERETILRERKSEYFSRVTADMHLPIHPEPAVQDHVNAIMTIFVDKLFSTEEAVGDLCGFVQRLYDSDFEISKQESTLWTKIHSKYFTAEIRKVYDEEAVEGLEDAGVTVLRDQSDDKDRDEL